MDAEFRGNIGRTFADSESWWRPIEVPSTPNVVIVVLDDVGYAQLGSYGSDIATPVFDGLAATGRRFANFHTTALCSPTRACLLTGRNHHTNHMARVVDLASGFPGYNAHLPKENGFLSEILREQGYATFCAGKWHLAPMTEMSMGGARDRWPLGRGFDRFYGFMGGASDQYHPELVCDNGYVEPPRTPEDGYHLTEDLVDRSIRYIADLRATDPDRPFLLWFAPGACHAPHQAPAPFIDRYRGRFDLGWDLWRDQVFERQLESGLLKPGTELSDRPDWVPAWESLSDDERTIAARLMEVFAGFLTHTDTQVGRLLEFIDAIGETDDTMVVLLSDNGASAEGGPTGSFNELRFFNFIPEDTGEILDRLDELGSPTASNHYPWGWAWAGNTPLKRFKRDTHEGGVADPLIIRWPRRLGDDGVTLHQYVHAIDLLPTILDLFDLDAPASIGGIAQSPIEGSSFAAALEGPDAPESHTTQYYEMLGSRAIYHEGWKAVTHHTPSFISYDGSDPDRSFDEDVWELYRVDRDFAEVHDLASSHPAKLAELTSLWWKEAARFQVLPLNNEPGRFGDPRYERDVHRFAGPVGPINEAMAPNLKNRASFTIAARLDLTGHDSTTGVVVAHGSHAGGYVLVVRDGCVGFTYNFVSTPVTRIVASEPLPTGLTEVVASFTRTGPGGDLELRVDGRVVATGAIPRTTPLLYGPPGFAVGFQPAGPVDPEIRGRSPLPPGTIWSVVVTAVGDDPVRAYLLAERADLGTQ